MDADSNLAFDCFLVLLIAFAHCILWNALDVLQRYLQVSDHIPVDADSNRPLFAAPNDSEAWVLLLEKACAKMLGERKFVLTCQCAILCATGTSSVAGLGAIAGEGVREDAG